MKIRAGQAERRERLEERRSEKRKSQKKEDADARKGRKVAKHLVFFKWLVALEGRKVGSLKRRVRSQLARWEMKNCAPLWREAHFQVKMYKTPHVRATFGGSDVVSRGRRKGLCTLSKMSKSWGFCSIFSYNHHYTTLHSNTLHYNYNYNYTVTTFHDTKLHYTTLHSITLNSIALHYITLHYTPLHYITLHYTTFHYTSLHYTTLPSTTLQLQLHNYTPLRSTTLKYTTLQLHLHYITPHYTPLHYTTLHYIPLHSTTLHYVTLDWMTLHHR